LDRILLAKGFPDLWRAWISMLNQTSQTAVLLDGVPGRWIQCRRGLRQGDPLSPFLFNILRMSFSKFCSLSRGMDCCSTPW
jgi:hypothetical protein